MTNPFRPGDQKTHRYVIQPTDLADFGPDRGGLVHAVCGTFALARELEWASRLFVLDMTAADEEGIGTALQIEHLAPAFAGETLTVAATFVALDGNDLRCSVEAWVGERRVASGRTGQRIVARARLAAHFAKFVSCCLLLVSSW